MFWMWLASSILQEGLRMWPRADSSVSWCHVLSLKTNCLKVLSPLWNAENSRFPPHLVCLWCQHSQGNPEGIFVWLVWVHDNIIVWPKLLFIIYNLLEPNSHPSPVTLDWNIPVCKWVLHCVCHKAMAITCRTIGNKIERDLERLPHTHLLLHSSSTGQELLIGNSLTFHSDSHLCLVTGSMLNCPLRFFLF